MSMGEAQGHGTLEPRAPWWRRYPSLYGALWRYSVTREMQFKANFLLWIVVEAMWFGLQLGFMSVIYGHTEDVAGWSRWQVILLVGCSHFIQQVFTAFFLTNVSDISEHIRTGRLDFMLLLPVNTRFLVSFRKVDLGAFVNAMSALAVIGWALRNLGHLPGPWEVAAFALLCGCGVVVHYSLMFMLASVAFWTVRIQGAVWGYYNLFNIARIPEGAFPHGWFRRVFTWVLPMILVSNVPSMALLGTMRSPWMGVSLAALALACLAASEALWRLALRRYASASA
jgi:ABC-2 type transport system permease protein